MEKFEVIVIAGTMLATLATYIAQYLEAKKRQKSAVDAVREAEKQAFFTPEKDIDAKINKIINSQKNLDLKAEKLDELVKVIAKEREATSVNKLFNLYNKQIEQYQQETRSRATLSFTFAIIAMLAGFAFVIWGGSVLLTASEAIALASGGILATVGGIVSGYIAKTFLGVHKLSLVQLNHYFQQPVINDHILMAQRLADDSDDPDTKKASYSLIIESITKLIDSKSVKNG